MTFNNRVFESLEIVFWDTTIPALSGVHNLRSKLFQLRVTANRRLSPVWFKWLSLSCFWGFGLLVGILIGLLQAIR